MRVREKEEELHHRLVHSLNISNSQGWTMWKSAPGGPSGSPTWATMTSQLPLLVCVNRKLEPYIEPRHCNERCGHANW